MVPLILVSPPPLISGVNNTLWLPGPMVQPTPQVFISIILFILCVQLSHVNLISTSPRHIIIALRRDKNLQLLFLEAPRDGIPKDPTWNPNLELSLLWKSVIVEYRIGIMEYETETTIVYRGYLGINGKENGNYYSIQELYGEVLLLK